MSTVRERLEALQRNAWLVSAVACEARALDIRSAISALDESETAWRADGGTYRLVSDVIALPAHEEAKP